MSVDIITAGLLAQIGRSGVPTQNKTEMQAIYNAITGNSYKSNFNDLGGVSHRVQKNSNFIHCEDMALQLAKFLGFDQFLATVIDDIFGSSLDAIRAFAALVGTVLVSMKSLIDGLVAVEAAIAQVLKIIKTAMDLLSRAIDNPCLVASAQMTYKYMSSTEKALVNSITSITNPRARNTYTNQYDNV